MDMKEYLKMIKKEEKLIITNVFFKSNLDGIKH